MFEKLEDILEFKFKNKKLLEEALTHPSMSFNQKTKFNYERLEFLGDSILSTIIAEYLFLKFKNEPEGVLSKYKHIFVSKEIISKIASQIELNNFLILSKGEEHTGGRVNINNLENTLEAVIGAVYLDSSFEEVKIIILKLWNEVLNNYVGENSKTELQEYTLKNFKLTPEYKVDKFEIINKLESFTITLDIPNVNKFTRIGHNIKEIEKLLAKDMLEYIKNNPNSIKKWKK